MLKIEWKSILDTRNHTSAFSRRRALHFNFIIRLFSLHKIWLKAFQDESCVSLFHDEWFWVQKGKVLFWEHTLAWDVVVFWSKVRIIKKVEGTLKFYLIRRYRRLSTVTQYRLILPEDFRIWDSQISPMRWQHRCCHSWLATVEEFSRLTYAIARSTTCKNLINCCRKLVKKGLVFSFLDCARRTWAFFAIRAAL